MKYLIVTGRLAKDMIIKQIEDIDFDIDVMSLPVTVASFITPQYAAKQLEKHDLSDYDIILIPGAVTGDLSIIEKTTGVPTYKGPLHAADLSLVLQEGIKLSKTFPANELIQEKLRNRALKEINSTEEDWREIISGKGGFLIRELPVSKGLPIRVLGEIVNAPRLKLEDIKAKALYYVEQGADIIDIGMLAGDPMPEKVDTIINTLRETVDLPLSIDTLNVLEIEAAIDSGIDLILSIDDGNMNEIASKIDDESVVVLPSNMREGYLPKKADERVHYLSEIINKLQEIGIQKIIGDLVVDPLLKPGLMEGLKAFQMVHHQRPEIPLLFGVGNAVELMDADSPGVHAALIALARESGACMLHVPEYSVKARGSVSEAVSASNMMFLAEKRGTVPKDLGLDLLCLKEKRWKEEMYDSTLEKGTRVLIGTGNKEYHPDKSGWFKIQVDRTEAKIVAIHYPLGINKPRTVIKSDNAKDIYQTIIREKLISKYDHAAYLGKELEKAAIALRLGRSYLQDEPLF